MPTKAKISAKDLTEIKELINQEKTHLENELSKVANKNPNNPDSYEAKFEDIGSDETETSSEVDQYTLNVTLQKTLEKSLKDIRKTLKSIDQGDYGFCKYCHQPIDIKRLKARPTSSACVSCKTKLKTL
ncbi:MAG: TraR/DksA C4-type zinc finger protein [Patescibacteria group bacterium]